MSRLLIMNSATICRLFDDEDYTFVPGIYKVKCESSDYIKSVYVSLLMAYLSYSFRVALHPSKPEDSAAPLAEHA